MIPQDNILNDNVDTMMWEYRKIGTEPWKIVRKNYSEKLPMWANNIWANSKKLSST